MSSLTRSQSQPSRWVWSLLIGIGVVLLGSTWTILYWSEALFTESHLVGYYCCVTEQDLPAPGTLERRASDFFRTSPGKHLPPVIFVAANASLFGASMWSAHRRVRWQLPLLFVALGALYLLVDFGLVGISWRISDRVLGPQTSPYSGYRRTGYGIVLHLMLWLGYLVALARIPKKLDSDL